MMEVSNSKGKKAITNYKTLEIFENKNIPTFSLLECKLETGPNSSNKSSYELFR